MLSFLSNKADLWKLNLAVDNAYCFGTNLQANRHRNRIQNSCTRPRMFLRSGRDWNHTATQKLKHVTAHDG